MYMDNFVREFLSKLKKKKKDQFFNLLLRIANDFIVKLNEKPGM